MTKQTAQQHSVSDPSELRRLAFSIAYRMLGSVAESEDLVQEALLRLHLAQRDGTTVESPKAFLATITTRLAIDYLRSARVRRESYTGSWLPEPLVGEQEFPVARHAEMAESVSMAFLVLLEALSPTERAVFLLRQVFDYGYGEIAAAIGKTEENCRQIFVRANRHIEAGKPRFEASKEKRNQLAEKFFAACTDGDLSDLVNLLASDAVFFGDGGGKAMAVSHPVRGRDPVARLLLGIFAKGRQIAIRWRRVEVNGQPGMMIFDSQDQLISVLAIDVADDHVLSIRSVINPDKLAHLGAVSDLARLPDTRRKRAE